MRAKLEFLFTKTTLKTFSINIWRKCILDILHSCMCIQINEVFYTGCLVALMDQHNMLEVRLLSANGMPWIRRYEIIIKNLSYLLQKKIIRWVDPVAHYCTLDRGVRKNREAELRIETYFKMTSASLHFTLDIVVSE